MLEDSPQLLPLPGASAVSLGQGPQLPRADGGSHDDGVGCVQFMVRTGLQRPGSFANQPEQDTRVHEHPSHAQIDLS